MIKINRFVTIQKMTSSPMFRAAVLSGWIFACPSLGAQEANAPLTNDEIARLKVQVAAQQKQIDELRRTLDSQQKLLDRATLTQPPDEASAPQEPNASPVSFNIGVAKFTPSGFIDAMQVIRSTNVGSGIGTNFGAIPFNNTVPGKLSESRFSLQNSRLALTIQSKVLASDVTAYLETDFLGNAPNNLFVTSNSATMRLRLFWVDIRKDKVEFIAGQSWSLLTPNVRGLSASPADIFYTYDKDPNYQAGLTWARQGQTRFIYHVNRNWAAGLSLESPEQFIGDTVVIPRSLASAYAGQFDTGAAGASTPNLHPDIIAKIAFDGTRHGRTMHLEAAGLARTFRAYNPLDDRHYTKVGGGGSVNFNFELIRRLRLIANTFVSAGGGRYIFGLGPDLVIRPNGDMSLVHSGSTVDGFEYTFNPRNNLNGKEMFLYAYYGGAYYRRNFSIDTTANTPVFVGYGFPGSSLGANRTIQEATFGAIRTFWKNPSYGDLKLTTQYSYVVRSPWFAPANNTQRNANTHMVYVNLRYDIP